MKFSGDICSSVSATCLGICSSCLVTVQSALHGTKLGFHQYHPTATFFLRASQDNSQSNEQMLCVSLSCNHKDPKVGAYNLKEFIVHGSGGRKSEIWLAAWSGFFEGLFWSADCWLITLSLGSEEPSGLVLGGQQHSCSWGIHLHDLIIPYILIPSCCMSDSNTCILMVGGTDAVYIILIIYLFLPLLTRLCE